MLMSVGELQKNISILNQIKEPIIIIDKRSNKRIVKIEPIKDNDMDLFKELIKDDIKIDTNLQGNFEDVYIEHLKGKYDFS